MRGIEGELDVVRFERSRFGVRPTPAGERAVATGRPQHPGIEASVKGVREIGPGTAGEAAEGG